MFADRLDFMMKLTGTHNSALGRAAHVDASTVSRLRAGKRELPKKQNFLPLMCEYFSRSVTTEYQRQSAANTLCPGSPWPEEPAMAAALIRAWLLDEAPSDSQSVARWVTGLAAFSFKAPVSSVESEAVPLSPAQDGFFYGNSGKRAAVTQFLSAVLASEKPRTLLLYSDENMDWLNEDEAFVRQWAALMQAVIQKGNRIRVIHTLGRTLDEMLEALNKWLGVYMTGAVEPYYCPRLRDGIARRTLFIAPELAAVAATSVGEETENALNLYVRDGKAVKALENEFARFSALCLPLMRILTKKHAKEARELLAELMNAEGDAIIVQPAPSLGTLPFEAAQSLCARYGDSALLSLREAAADGFFTNAGRGNVYEVFPLPNAESWNQTGVSVSAFMLPRRQRPCYQKAEYAAHLTGVAEALQKHPHYHVVLETTRVLPPAMALYHKTGVGTMIARMGEEPVAFAINEARMTAAFDEPLARQVAEGSKPENRRRVMERLLAAAKELRASDSTE